MKQLIYKLYEYLFQISSSNQGFEFRPKENERKIIDNFIEKLTPSHGEEWLMDYLCYQFSRYVDQKTRFGKGIVMVGWIFGQKAIDKFNNASEEERYYGEQFRQRFNIRNSVFKTVSSVSSKEYKDRERVRFKNAERQLIHCSELDLFDEKNKICIFCKNKEICKN